MKTLQDISLSMLDLVAVREGGTVRQALDIALRTAQHAERLGFTRYWLAEHHNMVGIASSATAVLVGHLAAGTERIRVGSGGIMLPNHAPLVVAEQFGTLATLYPGRIDLGLGRAPGTDQLTARALRQNLVQDEDAFPQDVLELRARFAGYPPMPVAATPGLGAEVDMWILGSSLFGAQLAATLGLPFGFASHFAPGELAVLVPGSAAAITAVAASRLMLLGGAKLPEERTIWWNLVSTRPERIEQAKADWLRYGSPNSAFPSVPDEHEFIPLPSA